MLILVERQAKILCFFVVLFYIFSPFNSFFTSPYLPSILEVGRTSVALHADDVR